MIMANWYANSFATLDLSLGVSLLFFSKIIALSNDLLEKLFSFLYTYLRGVWEEIEEIYMLSRVLFYLYLLYFSILHNFSNIKNFFRGNFL